MCNCNCDAIEVIGKTVDLLNRQYNTETSRMGYAAAQRSHSAAWAAQDAIGGGK